MAKPYAAPAAAVGGATSRWADLQGPVHYFDYGGPPGAPVLVAVHGLGGSALNWSAMAPHLRRHYRVLAPDLVGHGHTQSLGRSAGIQANAGLVREFIRRVVGGAVVLAGNSMGGIVTIQAATDEPGLASGLILIDAALPAVLARPDPLVALGFAAYTVPGIGWGTMVARHRVVPARASVRQVLALCCHDAGRIPPEIVEAEVAQALTRRSYPGVERDFLEAARSVVTVMARRRSYRARLRCIDVPVLLVHGTRDRLVPLAVARAAARAHPRWSFVAMPDVGHLPQLEAAEETARVVHDWLSGAGRAAAAAATANLDAGHPDSNHPAGTGARA